MRDTPRPAPFAVGVLAVLLVSCATQASPAVPPPARTAPTERPAERPAAQSPKVLNLAVTTPPGTFSIVGASAPSGGWIQITEIHSDGLITSEPSSRKHVGRLAEKVPSLEDGTLSILPDGKMRQVVHLRKGVTWHDGTPFTAQDLVFSFNVGGPGGIPNSFNEPMRRMESVEATDDSTVVMTYKAPYYLAVGLGPHAFWPLPKHILGEAYERYLQSKNPDDILTHPYWNTEYVHLGPFRLTSFDPGDRISFEAYPGYYLGRPKLDAIHVQIITDQNTALSNLLAGSIQVAPASALTAEAGLEAKRIWDASADGIVHVKSSSIRLFEPQHNPAVQVEPSTFDPRVRRAIYHALDREELAEVLNGSRDRVAWSLLEDGDPLLPAVKDGLRHFTFDPARSRALLAEVGWVAGADGALRHSGDGRTFQLPIWGTPGREQEMHIYASYLRAVGLEVEELMMAAARYRNREYRASFPGWDFTGTSLTKMMTDAASAPQNNWSGNNNGYDDPRARRLVDALESTMVPQEQAQAMKAIHDFVVAELPALPIYFLVQYTAVKKGVKAFEDIAGADGSDRQYGGYARNAYLWDVQ